MKRNYAVCALLLAAAMTTVSGCGTSATGQNNAVSERPDMPKDENLTYGEVKKTDTGSITIEIGSRKQPQEQKKEDTSMLELTGEEKEITVSDDTEIVRRSMGDRRGGEQPKEDIENGEQTEKEPPQDMENGEKPEDGEERKRPEEKEEKLEFSDISEGDIVAVSMEDGGSAEKIIVMSPGESSEENSQNSSEERSM